MQRYPFEINRWHLATGTIVAAKTIDDGHKSSSKKK